MKAGKAKRRFMRGDFAQHVHTRTIYRERVLGKGGE
jgi:hypothetical protein